MEIVRTALLAIMIALACAVAPLRAQQTITIHADKAGATISRDIFGQFAEHLGEGIYGGIWVGEGSAIPNVRGIRSDVVQALRALKVPVVRWPGGCFADKYHWRDGIGPATQRRARLNADWGGVIEPNSFGTHEFMDFVEQIGSEAYVSVNLGSGTVQEATDWLEYMTAAKPTTLASERAANGRTKPWRVKYLGLGNESWGCGGAYSAPAYVERMKQFSAFVVNHNPGQATPSVPEFLAKLDPDKPDFTALAPSPNGMRRIAVGPDGKDVAYTEAVMAAWHARAPFFWNVEGLSLHSYTFGRGFPMSSSSTDFGEDEYARLIAETRTMDELIALHSKVMDKYDPGKKVALVVDEWGAWLKPVPGRNPVFLRQQNTLRDAIIAAVNLNIFARHADRVRMTNIAQMVNVMQSMILTDGNRMFLTPTYHVYRLYTPFQDAVALPVSYDAGTYRSGQTTLPQVDAIAARRSDGQIWLAVTNVDPNRPTNIAVNIAGLSAKVAVGETLTAPHVNSLNNFGDPVAVRPKPFKATADDGRLVLHLLPKSVTVVQVR